MRIETEVKPRMVTIYYTIMRPSNQYRSHEASAGSHRLRLVDVGQWLSIQTSHGDIVSIVSMQGEP